ncbi:MAG: carboxypeptidase regulatory-like domain-containing protein, partial [Thermoplasmata archaeon]
MAIVPIVLILLLGSSLVAGVASQPRSTVLARYPTSLDEHAGISSVGAPPSTGSPAAAVTPSGAPDFPTPIQHVVVVSLENQNYTQANAAPFLSYLAKTYSSDKNDYAYRHGFSFMALATTSGIDERDYGLYSATNLGDLATKAGETWATFEQNMPSACDTTSSSATWAAGYDRNHNPFIQYQDIESDKKLCDAHDLTFHDWYSDVNNSSIPNYSYITPDIINDGHNGSAKDNCELPPTGASGHATEELKCINSWLQKWLSPLINNSAIFSSTAFIITFDVANAVASPTVNGTMGGHIYFAVVSPFSRMGYTSDTFYNTYSVLTTTEWLLGLGRTGNNDNWTKNPPMENLFSVTPFKITGTVTSSLTGKPLVGAAVNIRSGPSTTTSSSGAYSLGVSKGTYTVSATLAGYVGASAQVTVTKANVVHNFALAQLNYTINGTVRYASNGTPDRSATVELMAGSLHSTVSVNSMGGFAFSEPNGTYSLEVSQTGYAPQTASITVSGKNVTHNFSLSKESSTFTISGFVVTGSKNRPLAGATVNITN